MPQPVTWQYRLIRVAEQDVRDLQFHTKGLDDSPAMVNNEGVRDAINRNLAKLGETGWELVSVHGTIGEVQDVTELVFKRPLNP